MLALSRILERGRRKHLTSQLLLPGSNSRQSPLQTVVTPRRAHNSFQPRTLHDRYPSMRKISLQVKAPSLRVRIWLVLQDPTSSRLARVASLTLLVAVLVSGTVFVLQTEPAMTPYAPALGVIETICMVLFSADFVVRLVCAPSTREFVLDLFNWIDVASIIPFYLELFFKARHISSLASLRVLRLFRVARIFKLSRYTSSAQMFFHSIRQSSQALYMLLFLVSVAMVMFSSALYVAEYTDSGCIPSKYSAYCQEQDTEQSSTCCDPTPFYSIGATLWWSIATMATVGYGDDVPATPQGQAIASLALLAGILILALPTSVIGGNFQRLVRADLQKQKSEQWHKQRTHRPEEQEQYMRGLLIEYKWMTTDEHIIEYADLLSVYDAESKGYLSDAEMDVFEDDLIRLRDTGLHSNQAMRNEENGIRCSIRRFAGHVKRSRFLEAADELVQFRLLESEAMLECKLAHLVKRIGAIENKLKLLNEEAGAN
ncbi:Voltage-gated Ion Channel (VIC) Superfamily [Achlya hypogyna]|uniref:Voltage-gated Ion Channel (VIC) Superfamily n=1 Tax=Achlya hypogyna TaxID=1202772 RepID=A0A1V9ZH48_ACHHY|nr:Voltage-gated Ion Channel (VIC) Superfamily [Achlya hypogyna]